MSSEFDVIERFLRYVSVDTESDENSTTFPSTEKQKDLGRMLAKELEGLGAESVHFDEQYGYVYATIPSTYKDEVATSKVLAFIAHMDTSPELSGCNVNPQIVKNYDGKDIILNASDNIVLSPNDFPELLHYIGQDLITTDGTTLLGADDKAGVAEIMAMAAYLLGHKEIEHGKIAITFTPDEEVGAGVDHIDLKRVGADYAYTVDGGGIGELEYENFNAAAAKIIIKGRSVHPGDAKNKMKNASLMAMELEQRLPALEKPEHTEKYEGFFHLIHLEGSVEEASMEYIIRDHELHKFEEKKQRMEAICKELNAKYGEGSFTLTLKDQYYNMLDKIKPYMFLIEDAKDCMKQLSIEPKIQPIRGGTDGARLSYMGLPCPNLCTGGHNYHGRYEYCCIQSMEKIVQLLVLLACKQR
jgi:tripeptide aminopeptidase